eukprot:GHUV01047792.1.p1 GENE.GHUV01047792.1~~GHUV01047792.1.p1  ORF type:complete len:123 (-),score=38.33 GHUV01047792.1:318-686(-)
MLGWFVMLFLQEQKQLKQLMYALSAHTDSLGGQGNGSMTAATRAVDIHAKELAFVFTDIENSTEISNQDPASFKQVCVSVTMMLPCSACCSRHEVGKLVRQGCLHGVRMQQGCTLGLCSVHL